MMRTYYLWPGIIVLSVIAVGLVTFDNAHGPVRPFIALWFLFICPGMALVRPLGLRETRVVLSLAVGLSLALDTVVSSVMLYGGMWSPNAALIVLMIIASGGGRCSMLLSRVTGPLGRRQCPIQWIEETRRAVNSMGERYVIPEDSIRGGAP